MNKNNTAKGSIPPLLIVRHEGNYACGVGNDVLAWITRKVLRRSDAFIIHDPDRSLWDNLMMSFCENDYILKILNLTESEPSMRYNPFMYVKDERGISKFAASLISGTKGLGEQGDIDFIVCETMLLEALISYINREIPTHEQTIKTLVDLLEHMVIENYQEGYVSATDIIFGEKCIEELQHPSVLLYAKFKNATGSYEEVLRIAESCIARLSPFRTRKMSYLLSGDDLRLDRLTAHKTALFIVDGNANEETKMIIPLMYSQLLDALHQKHD